jgi:hypothetical protein
MTEGKIGNIKSNKKKITKVTGFRPKPYRQFKQSNYYTSRGCISSDLTGDKSGKNSTTAVNGNVSPNPVGTPLVYNIGQGYKEIETKRKMRSNSGRHFNRFRSNSLGAKYITQAKKHLVKKGCKKGMKPQKKNLEDERKLKEENDKKERDEESVRRIAKSINIVKDDDLCEHTEGDVDDIEEKSPFDRKIIPNKTSIVLSQIEELNAIQNRATQLNSFGEKVEDFEISEEEKSIFNNFKNTHDDVNREVTKFSEVHHTRDSLVKLRDHYQRSTQYQTTYSGSSNLKKSLNDKIKSRNLGLDGTQSTQKKDIYTIDEINTNKDVQMKDKFYSTMGTP